MSLLNDFISFMTTICHTCHIFLSTSVFVWESDFWVKTEDKFRAIFCELFSQKLVRNQHLGKVIFVWLCLVYVLK
jgi:hypothetical protein